MRGIVVAAALSIVLLTSAHAHADETREPTGLGAVEGDDVRESVDDDRSAVHYRGRAPATSGDDIALWIPRVLLFPIHLVTEYLLRLPLLALLTWAETNHVFAILDQILNPTPDISWSPTVSLEAGVFALPGLQGRWRNMGVLGHELRISGTFAGAGFWSLQLRDQWSIGPTFVGVRGGYTTRPDRAFYGLGPSSPSFRTNFRETRGEASAFVGIAHENHVRLEVTGGYSREEISEGMSPSVQLGSDRMGVPGTGPFDLALVGAELRLDTRRELEESGGLRLRANGLCGYDAHTASSSFLTIDGEIEAAIEVAHPDRVLAVRVYVAETLPLGHGPVPFLHLATLGWNNHEGFVLGRFRGEAAFLTEIRYRYPVAYFVDVQWVASVGNVFARDFADFTAGALTGSIGVGFRTRRTGSDPMEITVALGTSRFDTTFGIDSVRLYLSTTQGL